MGGYIVPVLRPDVWGGVLCKRAGMTNYGVLKMPCVRPEERSRDGEGEAKRREEGQRMFRAG
eukprot:768517-Hanusia_phi.AAC.2